MWCVLCCTFCCVVSWCVCLHSSHSPLSPLHSLDLDPRPPHTRDKVPFVVLNAAAAGLWGAAFNSGRMTLWRVRASKTRHVLRIAEAVGLAALVTAAAFLLPWAAGRCVPKNPDWGEDYGVR